MTVKRTKKGTTTVTRKGPIVADASLIAAVAAVSNARDAVREIKKEEDDAKVIVLAAVGSKANHILDEAGNLICEVKEVATSKVTLDGFLVALEALYPAAWAVLMDLDPRAVDAAKVAATESSTYLKVLPK